jgi:preprotein translocase subunit SecG
MAINETILGLNILFTITTIVMFYMMKKEQERHWESIEKHVQHYIHNVIRNEKIKG